MDDAEPPASLAAPLVLSVRPARVRAVLLAVIAGLVLGHLATQAAKHALGRDYLGGLVWLFDLDREANLPSYFAALQLLLAAVLLAVVAARGRREGDPFSRHWTLLSLLFLYMSVDEAATVHELLNPALGALLGGSPLADAVAPWVVPAGILVVGLALGFATFVRRMDPRLRARLLLAGTLFVAGAVGVDMAAHAHATRHGEDNAAYAMGYVAFEEALEMVGVLLLVAALLGWNAGGRAAIRLEIEGERAG